MSGTLTTNYFTSASITSESTTRISESMSRKTQRKSVGGQHWMIQLDSKNLDRSELGQLYSFLAKQQGSFDNFTVVPPIYGSTASEDAGGNPTITDDFAAGVTQVKANQGTGSLKAGDFIKFSNHDKVYMLTADVDQDISTQETFEFTPPLVTAVDNTTTIDYNDVAFKVYLTNDRTAFKTNTDGTSRIQITVREDI
jgi:hypothetical protein